MKSMKAIRIHAFNKEHVLELLRENPAEIHNISAAQRKNMTEEMCLAVVQHDGMMLELLPENLRTFNVCMAAASQNGRSLFYVPRTGSSDICMAAVKQDPDAIRYMPMSAITEDIALEVVRRDGMKLSMTGSYSDNVALVAVQQNGLALQQVRGKPSSAICLAAIRQNPEAVQYVPDSRKTEELLIEAVSRKGDVLRHMPDCPHTVRLAALKQDGMALRHVDPFYLSKELCLAAVTQNGMALELVPKQMRDKQICEAAVLQNGMALALCPEEQKTQKLCEVAMSKTKGAVYPLLPKEIRENKGYHSYLMRFYPDIVKRETVTHEDAFAAVEKDGMALRQLAKSEIPYEVCLAAVQQNGLALQFVPREYRTTELCLEAVQRDCQALHFVPESRRTAEVCLTAFEQDYTLLPHIPEKYRTVELCLEACLKDPGMFFHVGRDVMPDVIAAYKEQLEGEKEEGARPGMTG